MAEVLLVKNPKGLVHEDRQGRTSAFHSGSSITLGPKRGGLERNIMTIDEAMLNVGSVNSKVYVGVMCDADLSHEGNMRETTFGEFQKNLEEMEQVEMDHIMEDAYEAKEMRDEMPLDDDMPFADDYENDRLLDK